MKYVKYLIPSVAVASVVWGAFVSSAMAGTPTGEWARFKECPYEKYPEVVDCLYSETTSGEVAIGSTTVPIQNKIILQGGATYNPETEKEQFFNASNGETLTKVAQNVPGGISGIVPEESLPGWLKVIFSLLTENGATGVTATAEQAGAIELSKANLSAAEGVALKLPVRLHLSNPFLGSECYIGSNPNPIVWNLTAGTTKPPTGVEPLTGNSGEVFGKEKGKLLELTGNKLVENDFSVPTAEGCGGLFAFIVDPLIDLKLGLESPAGDNKVVLNNTIFYGSAKKTKESSE